MKPAYVCKAERAGKPVQGGGQAVAAEHADRHAELQVAQPHGFLLQAEPVDPDGVVDHEEDLVSAAYLAEAGRQPAEQHGFGRREREWKREDGEHEDRETAQQDGLGAEPREEVAADQRAHDEAGEDCGPEQAEEEVVAGGGLADLEGGCGQDAVVQIYDEVAQEVAPATSTTLLLIREIAPQILPTTCLLIIPI